MKVRLPNNGGGNMNQMLAKAQKMQADMQSLQADLEQREYTAVAGGGMVEITVDGKHLVKSVKINPEVVDTDDIEMLEDFITIAFNEAVGKAMEESEQEMGAITSGLNLPGMF